MAILKARIEFASALNQVCAERSIDPETGATRLFSWREGKKKSTKKDITPPGFGRVDMIICQGKPYVLEINTILV